MTDAISMKTLQHMLQYSISNQDLHHAPAMATQPTTTMDKLVYWLLNFLTMGEYGEVVNDNTIEQSQLMLRQSQKLIVDLLSAKTVPQGEPTDDIQITMGSRTVLFRQNDCGWTVIDHDNPTTQFELPRSDLQYVATQLYSAYLTMTGISFAQFDQQIALDKIDYTDIVLTRPDLYRIACTGADLRGSSLEDDINVQGLDLGQCLIDQGIASQLIEAGADVNMVNDRLCASNSQFNTTQPDLREVHFVDGYYPVPAAKDFAGPDRSETVYDDSEVHGQEGDGQSYFDSDGDLSSAIQEDYFDPRHIDISQAEIDHSTAALWIADGADPVAVLNRLIVLERQQNRIPVDLRYFELPGTSLLKIDFNDTRISAAQCQQILALGGKLDRTEPDPSDDYFRLNLERGTISTAFAQKLIDRGANYRSVQLRYVQSCRAEGVRPTSLRQGHPDTLRSAQAPLNRPHLASIDLSIT